MEEILNTLVDSKEFERNITFVVRVNKSEMALIKRLEEVDMRGRAELIRTALRHYADYLGMPFLCKELGPVVATKNSRLSTNDVLDIRTRRAGGESLAQLSEAFNLSISAISKISSGKRYTNIGGPRTARK
jgi:hypothetical protein